MSAVVIILVLVMAQRIAELAYATINTRALLKRGGVEVGRAHYPLFVLLHGSWLVALYLTVPGDAPISRFWLAAFILLQSLRLWVIQSLGSFWTTRVITLPGMPLVRRGPYRLLRHPNYAIVIGEMVALPMTFGAWRIAAIFSLLNLALLAWRIRVEEQTLAPRRGLAG